MTEPGQVSRYGAIARALHWIIAALIVVQFVLINLAEDNPSKMQQLALIARHKSFGMTVLMLAVVRLLWRLFNPPPPLPAAMKPYERTLAKLTHAAFYGLLFALPLAGWLMSSARGFTVSWFGLFSWPDLIAKNPSNFELLKEVHESLATVLFFLAILHIAAALKHHFWDKDDVLRRMLPFGGDRSGS
jgi:cytochrome b561